METIVENETEKAEKIKETPLKEEHERLGAKMVPFAGWRMPIQYEGILAEHEAVRKQAGLFDVSHMGQFFIEGPGATAALERLLPVKVARVKPLAIKYAMLLNDGGGVVDDILLYRREAEESYLLVVNASNAQKDEDWIRGHLEEKSGVVFRNASASYGMIALQGPRSEAILQPLVSVDLSMLGYYHFVENAAIDGVPCVISRTGYTGEDGFELMIPVEDTAMVWRTIMESEAARTEGLKPAGLGARDILRLEAGMPLHGHELSDEVGPLEGGLERVVAWDKEDFIGRQALSDLQEQSEKRELIGLVMEGRVPARSGYRVLDARGQEAGLVTSGSPSPTLGAPIAMALVKKSAPRPLAVEIREKTYSIREVKLPFYTRRK